MFEVNESGKKHGGNFFSEVLNLVNVACCVGVRVLFVVPYTGAPFVV